MSIKEGAPTPETSEVRGKNVKVRNFWQRHAQKKSAEIFNKDVTGISTSAISPKGAEDSLALGETIDASEHGMKGYVSSSPRASETLENIFEGYQKTNPDTPVRDNVQVRSELLSGGPEDYLKLFDQKWSVNKAALLAQRGLTKEDFPNLSPDDQQVIAETAEAPVILEWLDDPDSELAKLYPPREAAANFAVVFSQHNRFAERLNSGSEVDIFNITHRTASEPLLSSGVLIRKSNGQRITKIAELGGALEVLEGWESTANTDDNGDMKTIISMRGEDYDLDTDLLEQLKKEGLEAQKEKWEKELETKGETETA